MVVVPLTDEQLPGPIRASYSRVFPAFWPIVVPVLALLVWGDFVGVGSRAGLTVGIVAMLALDVFLWLALARTVAVGDDWIARQHIIRRQRWTVFGRTEIRPVDTHDRLNAVPRFLTLQIDHSGHRLTLPVDLRNQDMRDALTRMLGPEIPADVLRRLQ